MHNTIFNKIELWNDSPLLDSTAKENSQSRSNCQLLLYDNRVSMVPPHTAKLNTELKKTITHQKQVNVNAVSQSYICLKPQFSKHIQHIQVLITSK